jgi:chromate reductase, NAD(P)H dehydrogenase (quinone)
MRVLGVSGSLRAGSYNTALLRASADLLPPPARLELVEDLAELPPYSEDLDREPAPAAVARLRERVEAADALLVATPEYNSSLPGQLKNALDWLSRPYPENALRDLPAAVIGASTGLFGAVWAQAEVRKVLTFAGADLLDVELPLGEAETAFDEQLSLVACDYRVKLDAMLAELVTHAADNVKLACT